MHVAHLQKTNTCTHLLVEHSDWPCLLVRRQQLVVIPNQCFKSNKGVKTAIKWERGLVYKNIGLSSCKWVGFQTMNNPRRYLESYVLSRSVTQCTQKAGSIVHLHWWRAYIMLGGGGRKRDLPLYTSISLDGSLI